MGRVLVLTTPHETGNDVRAFQNALTTNNYYHGQVNGVYDPLTAQAAYRAKYWLGYRVPDQVAGDRLYGYLMGAPTTVAMKLRARNRRQTLASTPLRTKALTKALTYKGVKETPPGSNQQPFGVWYGMNGVPWCNIFVSYCYVAVGSKAFVRGHYYSYVPYMASDAHSGRNHLTVTHSPEPGDVVTFDWPGESPGTPDHTGLFVKWLDPAHNTFATIEGNTAIGNNSNGGEVCYREDRVISEVYNFIHVGA